MDNKNRAMICNNHHFMINRNKALYDAGKIDQEMYEANITTLGIWQEHEFNALELQESLKSQRILADCNFGMVWDVLGRIYKDDKGDII